MALLLHGPRDAPVVVLPNLVTLTRIKAFGTSMWKSPMIVVSQADFGPREWLCNGMHIRHNGTTRCMRACGWFLSVPLIAPLCLKGSTKYKSWQPAAIERGGTPLLLNVQCFILSASPFPSLLLMALISSLDASRNKGVPRWLRFRWRDLTKGTLSAAA